MKKILIVLITLLLFIPLKVNGLSIVKYDEMNLQQALDMEEINIKVKKVNTENPIRIYLFMGDGCPHCKEFLEYSANVLMDKYGDKIKFSIYEVWNNENNKELFEKVKTYFKLSSNGVPLIVIGDDYYLGYTSSMNADIESAIEKEYAKKERFNILEEASKVNETRVEFLNSYEYDTFKEVLVKENITQKDELLYNKDKLNIYVFYGMGCSHCHELFSYFNDSLANKYNNMINIISFEVWNNDKNEELLNEVSKKLNVEYTGVPYYVIGDKVFNGYSDLDNEDIEKTIDEQYKEKKDIVKEIVTEEKQKDEKGKDFIKSILPALYIIALLVVIFIVMVIVAVVIKVM